mgnify:CR=1 FL=1
MPAYAWKGKNRMGEVQEGVLVSDSRDAAASTLKRNGIEVMNIRVVAAEGGKSLGKVPPKALAIFTRQFSVKLSLQIRYDGAPAAGYQTTDRLFTSGIQISL